MREPEVIELDPDDPDALTKAVKKFREEHGLADPQKFYFDPPVNVEKRQKLWALCQKFVADNKISCPESVYQCDHVIEHGYDFIAEVCKIVGFHEESEP